MVLRGKRITTIKNDILREFEHYLSEGKTETVIEVSDFFRRERYLYGDSFDAFFSDIICAVIRIAIRNSARKLLAEYSGISEERWNDYFVQKNSIKMVWPAQKLIGEKGILRGENAIVQLPTGVGKTKSIELIIRSMFMSDRGILRL